LDNDSNGVKKVHQVSNNTEAGTSEIQVLSAGSTSTVTKVLLSSYSATQIENVI
jgi:hypothetical protein